MGKDRIRGPDRGQHVLTLNRRAMLGRPRQRGSSSSYHWRSFPFIYCAEPGLSGTGPHARLASPLKGQITAEEDNGFKKPRVHCDYQPYTQCLTRLPPSALVYYQKRKVCTIFNIAMLLNWVRDH